MQMPVLVVRVLADAPSADAPSAGASAADAVEAAERAGQLRGLIDYHTRRYFVDDDPEITDAEFDALVAELAAIEARPGRSQWSGLDFADPRRGRCGVCRCSSRSSTCRR